MQQAGFSIGNLGDYGVFEGLDEDVASAAKRAVDLLKAEPLTGGQRTVILDPVLAGVFVHEAFGHLSEADNVYENEKLKELMYMGRKFGGEHLNFTDGAALGRNARELQIRRRRHTSHSHPTGARRRVGRPLTFT